MEMFMQLKLVIKFGLKRILTFKISERRYTQVTNQTEWSNLTTGACYYENSTANGTTYGSYTIGML
jgi:lysozyme family protein